MAVNFTRGLSNWTAGTASVTNGLRTVTFVGANLIAADPSNTAVNVYAAGEGDMFIIDGVGAGSIKSVDSALQATLDYPWQAASQTNVAYRIRRYNEVKTGEVAKYIQAAQTVGQDSNPVVSLTIDDGVARAKLRDNAGVVQLAVGAAGAADEALKATAAFDPSSGQASFPFGVAFNNPGFRNRLINGDFSIWQRGLSLSLATGAAYYTADRFRVSNNLGVAATVARVAAPAGFPGIYALNIQATGAAVNGTVDVAQRCEASMLADLDGKACVLSFYVNAATSAGALTCTASVNANTALDNNTWSTYIAGRSVTLPTGSGRVQVALSASEMAALKYGAQIWLRFTQTNSSGNPNITIGCMQFEADPSAAGKANPFEFTPHILQRLMCQRYFATSYQGAATPGTPTITGVPRMSFATAANYQFFSPVFLPQTMRASPTVVVYSPVTGASGNFTNINSGTDYAGSIQAISTNAFGFMASGAVSVPAGGMYLHYTADAEL